MFQSNQLTQIIIDTLLAENGLLGYNTILFAGSALTETGLRLSDVWIGLILVILVSLVIFGGIRRIGQVASMLVPLMILIYLLAVSYIVITNISDLPHYVALIFTDAFTAQAGAGGALRSEEHTSELQSRGHL